MTARRWPARWRSWWPWSRRGRLAACAGWLRRIERCAAELSGEADDTLQERALSLRYRAKARERWQTLLPEVFALVREGAGRRLGLRHHAVQLLAGVALCRRAVVEMQTGEGKTLTATLPVALHALAGRGAHVATANDYLARRDADWMRPVYEFLGLTVGVVQEQMPAHLRRQAYACDVTYGTAKEFGFDFLRDQLTLAGTEEGIHLPAHGRGSAAQPTLQRKLHFALVDEADSLLIDEARTPLIISRQPGEAEHQRAAGFRWAAAHAAEFEPPHDYTWRNEQKRAELTPRGREQVRLLPKPETLDTLSQAELYEFIERAIRAERAFARDQHYAVIDGRVVIVDEFTGRLGQGRKWRDGLHQAIEAREGVEITLDAGQAARVTVQEYFRQYEHLAGMTGTALSSARELRKVYRLDTLSIPTHRPVQRQYVPTEVCGTSEHRWQRVCERIAELHAEGRPVLIGTRSIEKSELLSQRLRAAAIPHQVLNARHVAEEAQIIARAGERGRVTVATNMAGRGTDIALGPGVAELGGLYVIATEMHDSARIDRQLAGRAARQGEPGAFQQFLSLEDDLLREGFGESAAAYWQDAARQNPGPVLVDLAVFHRAQRQIERRHERQRRILWHYEKHRREMHARLGLNPYTESIDED